MNSDAQNTNQCTHTHSRPTPCNTQGGYSKQFRQASSSKHQQPTARAYQLTLSLQRAHTHTVSALTTIGNSVAQDTASCVQTLVKQGQTTVKHSQRCTPVQQLPVLQASHSDTNTAKPSQIRCLLVQPHSHATALGVQRRGVQLQASTS